MNYTSEAWMDQAICAGTDPEAFFPEKGGSTQSAMARMVCRGCPVISECLDYALEHNAKFGIWGGLTDKERRGMRYRDH